MMVPSASQVLLWLLAGATLLVFAGFGVLSWREAERRAALLSVLLALAGGALFWLAAWMPALFRLGLLVIVGLLLLAGLLLWMLPIGRRERIHEIPEKQFDERDIMFARARLAPGSATYQAYYSMRPQHKEADELTRSKPGLLSLHAKLANPFLFAAPAGSFTLTEALRDVVDGEVSEQPYMLQPAKMTAYIKNLTHFFGALDVGICELKPYHIYSHIGRGAGVYGAPVELSHKIAIAFTVEMDYFMIGSNPRPAGVMESARQYVEAARVAVQLAAAIRHLGWGARAHIDGNYRLICPLVARDAGLGEIGRMGLLMTPRQGPRVRLGVVTTDLALLPDQPTRDGAVIDFCTICQKCAHNCPVQAIPAGQRQEIDGALRWQINADTCFRYWNVVGTDCGRCMTVCPYAHADHPYHNLIRWGSSHSGAFRRLALRMDDWFYGNNPAPRAIPGWLNVGYKKNDFNRK